MRPDGRAPDELRPISFERDYTDMTPGSVLVTFGRTRVLCTVSIEEDIPRWLKGKGSGWVTAEYAMLPGSSNERIRRSLTNGRSQEIQRLIGRSLRAVTDLVALGETSITVDCDVLQADGGTRTAGITGAYVALADAVAFLIREKRLAETPIREAVAAVSVGVYQGLPVLDLDYAEDSGCDTDMNVVMTEGGGIIEVQGTAEGAPFSRAEMQSMLDLAQSGIAQLIAAQRAALG